MGKSSSFFAAPVLSLSVGGVAFVFGAGCARQARGVELVESDWDFSALITKQLGECALWRCPRQLINGAGLVVVVGFV